MSLLQTTSDIQRREEVLATSTVEYIQQATIPPIFPSIATIDPNGNRTIIFGNASQGSAPSENSGLNTGTKVGLAMIPVIIAALSLYILFLFWFRRRCVVRKTRVDIPLAVLEKDPDSYNNSFEQGHRTSKIRNMNAFSTPIYDQNCQAQMYKKDFGQRHPLAINRTGIVATDNLSTPPRSPHMVECGDSPIDGSSPFRLQRGDMVKRVSLGPDLARLWPSLPPLAWMKQTSTSESMPAFAIPEMRSS